MITRFISTSNTDGSFDFISNIILLDKLEEKHQPLITSAITWEPGQLLDETTLSIRATIYHEITHFLDATTTSWGTQYCFRKLQLLEALSKKTKEAQACADVFSIETGEIDVHSMLISSTGIPPSDCHPLTHKFEYFENFGVVLIIEYRKNNKVQHSVPLSTLSLIEANATANEFLSRLDYADSFHSDPVEKAIAKRKANDLFIELLNDPTLLEYSILLHLTKIHFNDFNLKELLILVTSLARFSLDISDLAMSAIANRIEESTLNKHLGHFISMELRRGSQRALIYFKSILFMYEMASLLEESKKIDYMNKIRTSPIEAIKEMWKEYKGIEIDKVNLDFEREFKRNMLSKIDSTTSDFLIQSTSLSENYEKLKNIPIGLTQLNELKLLNIALADNTQISLSNPIDLDVIKYCDDNCEIFVELTKIYKSANRKRIHMPPDTLEFLIK